MLTRLIAQPFVFLGFDLVTAARFVDLLWFTLGTILMFRILHNLNIQKSAIVGLVLLLASSPAAYWSATYITPDAMAILIGSLAAWLALRVSFGQISAWWLVAFAVFAALIKSIFVFSVLFISIFFLLKYYIGSKESTHVVKTATKNTMRIAVFSLAAALATQATWIVFQKLNSVDSPTELGDTQNFQILNFVLEVFKFLGNSASYGLAQGSAFTFSGKMLDTVVLFFVVASAISVSVSNLDRDLFSKAALITSLTAGPFLIIAHQMSSFFNGQTLTLGSRYGVVLLPIWIVASSTIISSKNLYSKVVFALGMFSYSLVIVFPAFELHGASNPLKYSLFLLPVTAAIALFFYSNNSKIANPKF
jgi:hypothetical protein